MSECVVRMRMPSKDTVCGMVFDLCGVWSCPVMNRICHQPDNRVIPSWCPIICQLPKGHGRLVDADACAGVLRKLENEAVKPTEKLCFGYAAKMFEEAFTIVPAEAERKVDAPDAVTPTDTPTVPTERSET